MNRQRTLKILVVILAVLPMICLFLDLTSTFYVFSVAASHGLPFEELNPMAADLNYVPAAIFNLAVRMFLSTMLLISYGYRKHFTAECFMYSLVFFSLVLSTVNLYVTFQNLGQLSKVR